MGDVRDANAQGSSQETIELLRNGAEVFPAWREAIASARSEVLVEMYWFDSDRTGRSFAQLLEARAREGLDVFILYDAFGSISAEGSMFESLRAAGAEVIEFNPVAPWHRAFRITRVLMRDHRKILVVDGEIGFTGGINLGDPWAPVDEGGLGWRDDCVRVRGRAATEMRAIFYDNWLRCGGRRPRRGSPAAQRTRGQAAAAARAQIGTPSVRAHTRNVTHRQTPLVQILGQPSWRARRTIRRQYILSIRRSRRRILIANSYFLPDQAVRSALERAAQRGVEVRVILPQDSDVKVIQFATRALYARLMSAGIHIHEWTSGMMHCKTALIDDWATVGSYNLDHRSLRYNLEVNAASSLPEFVAQVDRSFRADLTRCEEVDPLVWKRRPWTQKLWERFHFLFRKLL